MSNEEKKKRFRATFFPPFNPPYLVTNKGNIPLDISWFNGLED